MFDLYNGNTSILNISGNEIDDNCKNILFYMKKIGISCNIIATKSIINTKNDIIIENGCKITLCGLNTKYLGEKIWYPLKKEFNLNCCHLVIPSVYSGCINNFLSPSLCGKRN